MDTENEIPSPEEFAAITEDIAVQLTKLLAGWGQENTPSPVQFCAALGMALLFFIDNLTEEDAPQVAQAVINLFEQKYPQIGKAAA